MHKRKRCRSPKEHVQTGRKGRRNLDRNRKSDGGLAEKRAILDMKLKETFESIYEKYGRDFEGIADEIDIATGEIVVNNGHLLHMQNENDAGDSYYLRKNMKIIPDGYLGGSGASLGNYLRSSKKPELRERNFSCVLNNKDKAPDSEDDCAEDDLILRGFTQASHFLKLTPEGVPFQSFGTNQGASKPAQDVLTLKTASSPRANVSTRLASAKIGSRDVKYFPSRIIQPKDDIELALHVHEFIALKKDSPKKFACRAKPFNNNTMNQNYPVIPQSTDSLLGPDKHPRRFKLDNLTCSNLRDKKLGCGIRKTEKSIRKYVSEVCRKYALPIKNSELQAFRESKSTLEWSLNNRSSSHRKIEKPSMDKSNRLYSSKTWSKYYSTNNLTHPLHTDEVTFDEHTASLKSFGTFNLDVFSQSIDRAQLNNQNVDKKKLQQFSQKSSNLDSNPLFTGLSETFEVANPLDSEIVTTTSKKDNLRSNNYQDSFSIGREAESHCERSFNRQFKFHDIDQEQLNPKEGQINYPDNDGNAPLDETKFSNAEPKECVNFHHNILEAGDQINRNIIFHNQSMTHMSNNPIPEPESSCKARCHEFNKTDLINPLKRMLPKADAFSQSRDFKDLEPIKNCKFPNSFDRNLFENKSIGREINSSFSLGAHTITPCVKKLFRELKIPSDTLNSQSPSQDWYSTPIPDKKKRQRKVYSESKETASLEPFAQSISKSDEDEQINSRSASPWRATGRGPRSPLNPARSSGGLPNEILDRPSRNLSSTMQRSISKPPTGSKLDTQSLPDHSSGYHAALPKALTISLAGKVGTSHLTNNNDITETCKVPKVNITNQSCEKLLKTKNLEFSPSKDLNVMSSNNQKNIAPILQDKSYVTPIFSKCGKPNKNLKPIFRSQPVESCKYKAIINSVKSSSRSYEIDELSLDQSDQSSPLTFGSSIKNSDLSYFSTASSSIKGIKRRKVKELNDDSDIDELGL